MMYKKLTMQSGNDSSNEAFMPMAHPLVKLPVFEGPLDLLLFLIRRNEIDIYDIPIESITRQYLDIFFQLEQLDLNLAGDFFVMATTLMYIKSRMLLPVQETSESDSLESEEIQDDPHWELVQQLMEYKKIKGKAQDLQDLIEARQDYVPRLYIETKDNLPQRSLKPCEAMDIWQAFNKVLHRLSERIEIGEIHEEQVSVSDQMLYVLTRLKKESQFYFSSIIEDKSSLMYIVATFLALLELVRQKKVGLSQTNSFSDILCKWSSP